jgi:hypothetical protein
VCHKKQSAFSTQHSADTNSTTKDTKAHKGQPNAEESYPSCSFVSFVVETFPVRMLIAEC